ncbi:MAG TPA: hypothetical protein VFU88_21940 [Ktedonobacterales bacterium]|nr:hypothetical protein [Ktedonobacterales bacterium]
MTDIRYDELPGEVRDNLSESQWWEAQRLIIPDGQPVPETDEYINLKNGLRLPYQRGQRAKGPLLATQDLSGGHGQDGTQFHSTPPGAQSGT